MSGSIDVNKLSPDQLGAKLIKQMPQKYLDRLTAANAHSKKVALIVIGLGGVAGLASLGLPALEATRLTGFALVLAIYVIYSTVTSIRKYANRPMRVAWLAAALVTGATAVAIGVFDLSSLTASLLSVFLLAIWSVPTYFAVRSVAFLMRSLVVIDEATEERKRELLDQKQRELAHMAWVHHNPDGDDSSPPSYPPAAALHRPE